MTAPQGPRTRGSGTRPIRNDAEPMMSMVSTSIFLRPSLSPKWPKMTPPNGRARYPAAKVPKEKITEVNSSRPEKKTVGKTSAAAVP